MHFSIHAMSIGTFVPTLTTLSRLLEQGAAHVDKHGGDVAGLIAARLAPDMYTLAQQVELACDHALDAADRLAGGEGRPWHKQAGATLAALQSRITGTVDELRRVDEAALAGAESRAIEIPLVDDLVFAVNGAQYLRDWALPHFYFHYVTAYDILRHRGVAIGKQDYMQHIGSAIRKRGAA